MSPSTSPSQPSAFGLGDAGQQVAADLYDPLVLRRIRSKQPAWQATVLVDAARPVGSTAVAKGDPSPLEVAEELLSFLAGGSPVFLAGSGGVRGNETLIAHAVHNVLDAEVQYRTQQQVRVEAGHLRPVLP